jgi:hypothetical protein
MFATKYADGPAEQPDLHHPLMERPICAWPQQAAYKGKGSGKRPSSFVCR